MKFLVDVNLPPDLVAWMESRGHEAVYSRDVLPATALDEEIWLYARARQLVVISKDSDLADLSRRRGGPQIVWLRCGNIKLAPFKLWFDSRADEMLALLEAGEPLVELR